MCDRGASLFRCSRCEFFESTSSAKDQESCIQTRPRLSTLLLIPPSRIFVSVSVVSCCPVYGVVSTMSCPWVSIKFAASVQVALTLILCLPESSSSNSRRASVASGSVPIWTNWIPTWDNGKLLWSNLRAAVMMTDSGSSVGAPSVMIIKLTGLTRGAPGSASVCSSLKR